jgi:hypothetical protein
MDVVEHVEDYIGLLKGIKDCGHYKVFNIPLDMSATAVLRNTPIMHARQSVGHLHYFSRDTALATLEHCGYRIIREEYNHPFSDVGFGLSPSMLYANARKYASNLWPHTSVRILGGSQLLVLAE